MKWRNSLSVGYKPFDDDLKTLFKDIDKCLQSLMAARNRLASDADGLMDKLKQLFADSFEKQETLMQSLNFKGYYQHKYQHDCFLEKIDTMKDILMADNFSVGSNIAHINTQISQWLILHITTIDNEFGMYYLSIHNLPRVQYEDENTNGSNVYRNNGKMSKLQKMVSKSNNLSDDNIDIHGLYKPIISSDNTMQLAISNSSFADVSSLMQELPQREMIENIDANKNNQEFCVPDNSDSDLNDILKIVKGYNPFLDYKSTHSDTPVSYNEHLQNDLYRIDKNDSDLTGIINNIDKE